ncbi:unnamed protein product [Prorocentrum cordatum]|uniref:Uncharacterized protein n=1 Tax=Prorocentrum cordatum TaxID=2364126 RepID=A0ABN9UYD8_9DINO|nr:unnamed protein product [Polarella glacialis]
MFGSPGAETYPHPPPAAFPGVGSQGGGCAHVPPRTLFARRRRSDGATSNNRGADEDEDLFAAARGMKLFHISDVDVRPPPHTMDRSGMAPLPGWNGNVGRQRVER